MGPLVTVVIVVVVLFLLALALSVRIVQQYERGVLFRRGRVIGTRDNVSVDVSAVAYFRVVDVVKSVVAIENVNVAINQIAQTTLRKVVGRHTLDETRSETDTIKVDIRTILDVSTVEWGVEVTLVELKDIQLPDSMKRAMARQAEAEREQRAKIINAELGAFLARETAAAANPVPTVVAPPLTTNGSVK